MNLTDVIVRGGLATRAAEEYGEQRDTREHAAAMRKLGLRKAQAEDKLLDKDTALKQLRQNIEQTELEFTRSQQGVKHATAADEAGVARSTAAAKRRLQPGAEALAEAGQDAQLNEAREKQAANIWLLMRSGDHQGAIEALTNSKILHPGRKFSDVQVGRAPKRGPDGQPAVGPDGQPIVENVLQLVPADGGEPVFVPQARLDALLAKHYTRLEKVGDALLRIGPGNQISTAYQKPSEFAHTGEGDIYNKGTGEFAQRGLPGGARAPGAQRKEDIRLDNRVKMAIDKVIMPRFGGRFEGGLFFPDEANKDVATRAVELVGPMIRGGMDPEAAGVKATQQAEREKAIADAAKDASGGGGGYTGPRPWKR